jgi:hypothetical protein
MVVAADIRTGRSRRRPTGVQVVAERRGVCGVVAGVVWCVGRDWRARQSMLSMLSMLRRAGVSNAWGDEEVGE